MSDTTARDSQVSRVFISYSRCDAEFACRLRNALQERGFEAFLDFSDISPGDLWQDRLDGLILEADAVAFVLSPDWAASEVCRWEFRRANEFGKWLAPALLRPVPFDQLPKAITDRNFVYFNQRRFLWISRIRSFEDSVDRLAMALRIGDTLWRRKRSRFLARAVDWRMSGFSDDRLLTAGEWEEAATWMAAKPTTEDELPALLVEFLSNSANASAKQRKFHETLASLKVGVGALTKELIKELDLIVEYDRLPLDYVRRLPTAIVVADYGIIPYDDTQKLRENLLAWAKDVSQPHAAGRLYCSAGGYGKTRLALESITHLQEIGWRAGILPRTALEKTDVHGEQDADARLDRFFAGRGEGGALLVLDYAEGRAGQIERVTKAALRANEGCPIRIVLLARSAGDWWEQLIYESRDIQCVFERDPIPGMSEGIPVHRRATFFKCAASAFATKLLQAQNKHDPLLADDWDARPVPLKRLEAYEFCSPLSLAFEAFLHVRGVSVRDSPLTEMAREERRHWARALKLPQEASVRIGDPRLKAIERCVAVLTLIQGTLPSSERATDDALDSFLTIALTDGPVLGTTEISKANALAAVRTAIDRLYRYSVRNGYILRPVAPDLLGEHVVAQVLGRDGPGLMRQLLGYGTREIKNSFTVLDRISRPLVHEGAEELLESTLRDVIWKDFIEYAPLLIPVLQSGDGRTGLLLARHVSETPASQLIAILNILSLGPSLAIGPLRRAISSYLGQISRGDVRADDFVGSRLSLAEESDKPLDNKVAAAARAMAGFSSLEKGNASAAIRELQQVRNIFEAEAKTGSLADLERYANLLKWLGDAYMQVGLEAEALTLYPQAVQCLKRVLHHTEEEEQIQRCIPALIYAMVGEMTLRIQMKDPHADSAADALIDLLGSISEVGDVEFSASANKALGVVFNNLGIYHMKNRDFQKAKRALEQAIIHKRKLAELDRDQFGPDLASSLANLAQVLRSIENVKQ